MSKLDIVTKDWLVFVGIILLLITIQVYGDYCNTHAKERRQKEWERYLEKHNNIMAGNTEINWDAKN